MQLFSFLVLCVLRMEILLFNIHQVLKIVGGAKWEELNFHVYMQCFMKNFGNEHALVSSPLELQKFFLFLEDLHYTLSKLFSSYDT